MLRIGGLLAVVVLVCGVAYAEWGPALSRGHIRHKTITRQEARPSEHVKVLRVIDLLTGEVVRQDRATSNRYSIVILDSFNSPENTVTGGVNLNAYEADPTGTGTPAFRPLCEAYDGDPNNDPNEVVVFFIGAGGNNDDPTERFVLPSAAAPAPLIYAPDSNNHCGGTPSDAWVLTYAGDSPDPNVTVPVEDFSFGGRIFTEAYDRVVALNVAFFASDSNAVFADLAPFPAEDVTGAFAIIFTVPGEATLGVGPNTVLSFGFANVLTNPATTFAGDNLGFIYLDYFDCQMVVDPNNPNDPNADLFLLTDPNGALRPEGDVTWTPVAGTDIASSDPNFCIEPNALFRHGQTLVHRLGLADGRTNVAAYFSCPAGGLDVAADPNFDTAYGSSLAGPDLSVFDQYHQSPLYFGGLPGSLPGALPIGLVADANEADTFFGCEQIHGPAGNPPCCQDDGFMIILDLDFDNDGAVSSTDLAILLGNFGTPSGGTNATGDTDGDGDVDSTDLSNVLGSFGASC